MGRATSICIFLVAMHCAVLPSVHAQTNGDGHQLAPGSSWRLASPKGSHRWVVIHQVPSGEDSSYHIEVLEEKDRDPAWSFARLAPHMAISEHALRMSVLGPSRLRMPYPESYEVAYSRWRSSGHLDICSTSIEQCLQ
jgi:hypothetical protein